MTLFLASALSSDPVPYRTESGAKALFGDDFFASLPELSRKLRHRDQRRPLLFGVRHGANIATTVRWRQGYNRELRRARKLGK